MPMTGYLFLVLTVACFSMLGVLQKVADFRRCSPSAVNVCLFLWASCLMATYALSTRGSLQAPVPAAAVAVACGVCASVAILAFQKGIRFGKISTSWLIINLSTAVPTILSIVCYGEHVGFRRALALGAIVLSLFFLWKDKEVESAEKERNQSKVGVKSAV
jgi:drug/metabolite transporter (DMT)-like permease